MSAGQAGDTGSVRWVTATALRALAALQFKAEQIFTGGDLAVWTPGLTAAQRNNATSRLCALGFIEHEIKIMRIDGHDRLTHVYTVTTDGAAAIGAAAEGGMRKSGPKGSRKPNPVPPGALVTRLWALLRMRQVVDVDSAAKLLCDAGDDYEKVRDSARKYLRRWANAGSLAESARRIGAQGCSNGVKRYVLVRDSVQPPAWRQIAKQAEAAK